MKTKYSSEEKENFRQPYPLKGNRWQRKLAAARLSISNWNFFHEIQEAIIPQSQAIFARWGNESAD